jgi:diketogulonate reductase-like aldo/keto reductase
MTDIRQINIGGDVLIPQLGLGVFQVSDGEAADAVSTAIEAGYRMIDTAAIYRNERGTGEGLKRAGLARDEVFVTTKLWNDRQTDARAALTESLEKLGLDHVDLYLIHWPVPKNDHYVEAWRTLVQLRDEGLTRAVGVSNFTEEHLTRVIDETGVIPAVNQVEMHPYLQQPGLRDFMLKQGVTAEAWSPIGQGKGLLDDPALARLAEKHGKTAAQIVLRWHLQIGNVVIPKSVTPSRIRENIAVTDFELDSADMDVIAGMDRNARIGPDPNNFG